MIAANRVATGVGMEGERDQRVRERAYQLWEQGGRQSGTGDAHWFAAERELSSGDAQPSVPKGKAVPGRTGDAASARSRKAAAPLKAPRAKGPKGSQPSA